jgi:predicted dehydrogenase
VDSNPIIEMLGRRLRLGVIGGGPGSLIGPVHRTAARLDDRYEIVAGAVSSEPERSRSAGEAIGLSPERSYGTGIDLLDREALRDDRVDVVAIMTPNDTHHTFSMAALDRGFDVICDKPTTNTVDDAIEVLERVRSTGLVFCLTHNYTGYPMVRQARDMVESGGIGEVRLIQVEYVQGGKATESDPDPEGMVPWRYDPIRGGPSLVMGDIGTHAHNLVRFITGLEVTEVAAEIGAIVPNRRVDDFAGALLRFDNGARGTFWVTQAAAGVQNRLAIRVSGTAGSLEWMQEDPTTLIFRPRRGPVEVYTPAEDGTLPLSARASRLGSGHPEGFHEAFATIYSDAAEAIAARRVGVKADALARLFPNALDGVMGMVFVEAAVQSNANGGAWTNCRKLDLGDSASRH